MGDAKPPDAEEQAGIVTPREGSGPLTDTVSATRISQVGTVFVPVADQHRALERWSAEEVVDEATRWRRRGTATGGGHAAVALGAWVRNRD